MTIQDIAFIISLVIIVALWYALVVLFKRRAKLEKEVQNLHAQLNKYQSDLKGVLRIKTEDVLKYRAAHTSNKHIELALNPYCDPDYIKRELVSKLVSKMIEDDIIKVSVFKSKYDFNITHYIELNVIIKKDE